MRFFMYLNSRWVEKKIQLMAMNEDAMDETLDSASVQLYFDGRKDPYPARTLCKLQFAGNSETSGSEVVYYYTATDVVDIQTLDPRSYKHVLTLVQTTRKLSHYVLPNMVITQPRQRTTSAYFVCENSLNPMYYYFDQSTKQPTGISSWDGFTTRTFGTVISTYDIRNYASPYWTECLAQTNHTAVWSAVLRLKQLCLVGTADEDGSNATASWNYINRLLTYPSWIKPKLQVFHTSENINQKQVDADFADDKTILFSVYLTELTWTKDGGVYELTSSQLAQINSYTSGYIACELVAEVPYPSLIPDAFINPKGGYYEGAYDRLFVAKSEFTSNNIQTAFAYVTLELSYKRASLADTIERIAKRQQCKYLYSATKPLFHLDSSGEDYQLLSTTESPEFSFNNLTVFEALSQVLETVDALPRFEGDGLGANGYSLVLDYYNKTGSAIPNDKPFSSYTSNATEQKFDNGVLTSFQNAEAVSYFPSKPYRSNFYYARARVANYGIPERQDFVLSVDKPIKYINHLWLKTSCAYDVLYWGGTYYSWGTNVKKYLNTKVNGIPFPVDIASFVFDDATYSSALAQGDYPLSYNHNIRIQQNSLKFKQGGTDIMVGNKATNSYNIVSFVLWNCWTVAKDRAIGRYCINYQGSGTMGLSPTYSWCYEFSFCDSEHFNEVYFACEYGTDLSGRLEIQSPYRKEEGQFLASASAPSIDIAKLGLNMLGLSLRSGEPTMTCGQLISYWGARLKVGQVLTLNDDRWVVTKASYKAFHCDGTNDVIKGTLEFTKNFNGLAKRIGIDQSTRLYNVDRSIANLCEMNITDYVYCEVVGYASMGEEVSDGLGTCTDKTVGGLFLKALNPDSTDVTEVSFAEIKTQNNGETSAAGIYIPTQVYGSGNCVCFEAKFSDPMSAGVKMTASKDGTTYWWATDAWQQFVGGTYYYGTDVKYTDDEGYGEKVSVSYHSRPLAGDTFSDDFPDVKSNTFETKFAVGDLEFDKQPNEIFGLNYELAFLSRNHKANDEVFFAKRFFEAWDDRKKLDLQQLRLYWSDNEADRYSYADTKGKGVALVVTARILETDEAICIAFTSDVLWSSTYSKVFKSMALCDQNGNIIIAANTEVTANYTKGKKPELPRLHFFTKKERIE